MVAVRVMQVAVDEIINVVAMRYGLVPATGAMLVPGLMSLAPVLRRAAVRVLAGHLDHMLVDVIAMHVMQMSIVEIIDVVAVPDCGVAASRPVLMRVIGVVWLRARRHGRLPPDVRCRTTTHRC
jgi:hypothetical protein